MFISAVQCIIVFNFNIVQCCTLQAVVPPGEWRLMATDPDCPGWKGARKRTMYFTHSIRLNYKISFKGKTCVA